ncbi:MAG: tetratricopeptide repeat protein [Leptolyngbyaceae bacterium]|nr:tetratricopeptide repeat protein [Leptolyngbyaceae bacterium]
MKELDKVTAALQQKDYSRAAYLLKPLLKQYPDDLQIQLYAANIHEGMGHYEKAEGVYRQLLKRVVNPKLAQAARQGLERLRQGEKKRRQEAIAQASNNPQNAGPGFLLIAPIPSEDKAKAARSFSRIMNIDPYTANIQLPSRTWKLHRLGNMAELSVYQQELQGVGITTFAVSMAQLKQIQVFQVNYVKANDGQVTVVCQNSDGQLGELSFQWEEVIQAVEGLLPIFEEVVDLGVYNKLQRKEKTQDYAQVHDLHLPQRQCILRFCDRIYQFKQGLNFSGLEHPELPQVYATTRLKWNALTTNLKQHVALAPTWTDFSSFGPTALDHLDLLEGFASHINLFRKAETKWDHAFQLYSGTAFWYCLRPSQAPIR